MEGPVTTSLIVILYNLNLLSFGDSVLIISGKVSIFTVIITFTNGLLLLGFLLVGGIELH